MTSPCLWILTKAILFRWVSSPFPSKRYAKLKITKEEYCGSKDLLNAGGGHGVHTMHDPSLGGNIRTGLKKFFWEYKAMDRWEEAKSQSTQERCRIMSSPNDWWLCGRRPACNLVFRIYGAFTNINNREILLPSS